MKLVDLFGALCFAIYITVSALTWWTEAQQQAAASHLSLQACVLWLRSDWISHNPLVSPEPFESGLWALSVFLLRLQGLCT